MTGYRAKLRYSEMFAARNYLKTIINEIEEQNNNDVTKLALNKDYLLLYDILIDLDELFIKQISLIENEIDINHPAQ